MKLEQYKKLKHHLDVLGFDIADVPYTPIVREWERYPIIQALRKAEASTNIKYVNNASGECHDR